MDDGRPPRSRDRSDFEDLTDLKLRFEGSMKLSEGLKRGGLSKSIRVGHFAIARKDVPGLRIVGSQSYVVLSIYYQGLDGAEVRREAVDSLDARPPEGCAGWTLYCTLFSPEYHEAPVIVRPAEAGLVSLRDEIAESLGIALPILGFWIALCAAFVTYGKLTS